MAGNVVHLGIYGRQIYNLVRQCEWEGQILFSAENEIVLEFANNPDRSRKNFASAFRKFVDTGRFVFYTGMSEDEVRQLADHIAGKTTAPDSVIGADKRLDPVMTEMSTNFEDEINDRAAELKTRVEEICAEIRGAMAEAETYEDLPAVRLAALPIVTKASRLGEEFRVEMTNLLEQLPRESLTKSKCRLLVNAKTSEFARMAAEAFHSRDGELTPEAVEDGE